jgi:hypothetical protein
MKKEIIPDGDSLYRRAPEHTFKQKTNKFSSAAFKIRINRGETGLSVNWAKYATPQETAIDPVYGKKYYVGELKARTPRSIGLDVKHTPNKRNPSHSSITCQSELNKALVLDIAIFLAKNCKPIITSF